MNIFLKQLHLQEYLFTISRKICIDHIDKKNFNKHNPQKVF